MKPGHIDPRRLRSLRLFQRRPKRVSNYAGQHVRIWSQEHHAYWRAPSGYTDAAHAAAVYLLPRAVELTRHCGPEKEIWLEFLRDCDLPQDVRRAVEPAPEHRSLREIIARSIYRLRPFRTAESRGVMDGCLTCSRELSWDGAPAFYQGECYELADGIILDMVLAQQGELR